jgi:hypothetical protein
MAVHASSQTQSESGEGAVKGISRCPIVVVTFAFAISLVPRCVVADTLLEKLSRLSVLDQTTDVELQPGDVATFQANQPDFFGPAVQRIAIRGTDFPVASTVPGFSYVYNPQLQVLERSSQLGPVFSERAETVGRGRFEFGFSFLYSNLDKVDGGGFGDAISSIVESTQGNPVVESVNVDSFSLKNYVINSYLTYGLADNWDVNILVPMFYTRMDVDATRSFQLVVDIDSDGRVIPGGTAGGTKLKAKGDAFGPGDVLLRTKYRFVHGDPLSVAAALTIRTPTGEEDDFQGLGDWAVTPTLILSMPLGPVLLHSTLGMEVNADDLQRTRARYSLGGSWQFMEQAAFLADVLGSSALVQDEFTIQGIGAPVNGLDLIDADPFGGTSVLGVDRTDIIDLATGFKVVPMHDLLFYVGAIVSLNDQGLRADVIPTGSIEWSF